MTFSAIVLAKLTALFPSRLPGSQICGFLKAILDCRFAIADST